MVVVKNKTKATPERFADEARVDDWIAEHRPIVEDPEAGAGVLQRVVNLTVDEVLALGEEVSKAIEAATDATREYGKAQANPGTKPGALLILDKKRKALKTESDRLQTLYNKFGAFLEEAQQAYHKAVSAEISPNPAEGEPASADSRSVPAWLRGLFRR